MNNRNIINSFLDKKKKKTFLNKFEKYSEYIKNNEENFSSELYEIISSSWYYDPRSHKCPHDGSIDKIFIQDDSFEGNQTINIIIELFSAYGDYKLIYEYVKVKNYILNYNKSIHLGSHGDWLIDIFILKEKGCIEHSIVFSEMVEIIICCEEIKIVFEKITSTN